MYKIMMPQGRLVETSEILFVKGNDISDIKSSNIDSANGMVFRVNNPRVQINYWVKGVNFEGAFGTSVSAVWSDLLKKGYANFSRYAFDADIKAQVIDDEVYDVLLFSTLDISK